MSLFSLLYGVGCGRLWFDPTSQSVDAVAGDLSYYQTVKADNPVGYWRLNDTGTIAADEMNQHPGAISGPCVPVARGFLASDADGAMLFDNNCVISLGDSFEFLGRVPYSIEAWWSTNNGGTGLVFARQARNGNGPVDGYGLVVQNLALYQERAVAGINVQSTSSVIDADTMVHVVTTYDGSDLRQYAAGQLLGATVVITSVMQSITAETLIGCSVRNDLCFYGTIDEVSLYDYALTDAQIASHHAAGIR
jgi:hypothetical protein